MNDDTTDMALALLLLVLILVLSVWGHAAVSNTLY